MTTISTQMRAYRDALDRHGIPWADNSDDSGTGRGYHLHIERTVTLLDDERVSVIWGFQELPGCEPIGATCGWPTALELMYDPISHEPVAAHADDILREVFGIEEVAR